MVVVVNDDYDDDDNFDDDDGDDGDNDDELWCLGLLRALLTLT